MKNANINWWIQWKDKTQGEVWVFYTLKQSLQGLKRDSVV